MAENKNILDKQNYQNLLTDVQSLINKGKYKAYKAFDNILVQTNWQIGERIVREELENKDRADYGKYLIRNLALDLNIDRKELYKVVKFYRVYEIVGTVSRQLSWYHYLELIRLKDDKIRGFYQKKIEIHAWSVRELRKQIRSQLYEKTSPKEIADTFKTSLPSIKPSEIFKDTYDFDFIALNPSENEKDLEDKILANFEKFLKELGEDFLISGRQKPIKIDGITHYIDLVLYHRAIPCVILVDLKIGKLDSRDIGQMNKYVNYYRQNKQYAYEQDAIGLIICKEAGSEEVVYALGGLEKKIFIAKYKVKLPSEAKIKKVVKNLEGLN